MNALESQIQERIATPTLSEKEKWAHRFLAGGAIYFLLGGREVRAVVAAGTVYYLVQKKVIKDKTEDTKNKVQENLDALKKKLFGK